MSGQIDGAWLYERVHDAVVGHEAWPMTTGCSSCGEDSYECCGERYWGLGELIDHIARRAGVEVERRWNEIEEARDEV